MAHQSIPRSAARVEDVVRILVIVGAVIVAMLALNVIFGFNGTGPWTGLTPDLGRPF
jgi:hypothetical protein